MQTRNRWASWMFVLAIVLGLGADTHAQMRMAVKTRPAPATFGLTEQPKLTADLAAVVAAKDDKAKFIGVTIQGEAIVEFPSDVTPQAATVALAEAPRHVSVRAHAEKEPFERANKLIVVYSGKKPPAELAVGGLKVVDIHPEGQFVVVQSEGGFTADQIEKLAAHKDVRLVQPNYLYRSLAQRFPVVAQPTNPNDPLFPQLWGMKNIHAPDAWSKIHASSVRVAVIDTGIDLKHPDLATNIVPGVSKDFTPDGDPMDLVIGHGTHCAGTIGAVGDNNVGVVGVMWKAQVFTAKIFAKNGSFAGDVEVAKAIDYSVAKGAKVLSNSWGGGAASPVLQAAIDRADQQGVLFIAAAGNGNPFTGIGFDTDVTPFYPASYPNKNIISVLAIDEADKKAKFSNFGKTTVDIGAPGVDVLSTIPNKQFGKKSGTSMATPHVAGAAALIWGHPNFKNKTHVQIKSLILKNARPLPDLAGKCVTNGTLDIHFLEKLAPVAAGKRKQDS